MTKKKLTDQQRVFLDEYLTTWNATHAARAAGYADPNAQSSRLLRHPLIRAEIEQRLTDKAMSANEVIERLAQQARGDIAQFLTIETVPHPDPERAKADETVEIARLDVVKAAQSGYSHLIKSINYTNNGPRIEMYDAQAALLKLGDMHRLFKDVQLQIDMSQLTDEELARVAAGDDPIKVIASRKREPV